MKSLKALCFLMKPEGIVRGMMLVNPAMPNFLDEKDDRFAGLRGTRDVVARKLHENGVGASVKHTATTSQEKEAQLWSEGVLDLSSSSALLNAVLFYNGKTMCLRGGREHKALSSHLAPMMEVIMSCILKMVRRIGVDHTRTSQTTTK